jgi:hypothetical protein
MSGRGISFSQPIFPLNILPPFGSWLSWCSNTVRSYVCLVMVVVPSHRPQIGNVQTLQRDVFHTFHFRKSETHCLNWEICGGRFYRPSEMETKILPQSQDSVHRRKPTVSKKSNGLGVELHAFHSRQEHRKDGQYRL